MKNSKCLLVGLWALLTVAAVGLAWQFYWKAARLEASSLAGDDNAGLQKRLADAERRNRALEVALDAQRDAASDSATDATAAAPARNANQNFDRGPRADMRALMDQPEMQRLRALQQRAALDARFAPLFKTLTLSPAKLDQFKSLLAERESTMQDVMMAAREQGVDPRNDPEGFRKLVTAAQSEVEAQLKSLLGDEAYTQYEQYAQTQPQRATVEQLRTSLSYTSEPLTDGQATQLVQILAATSSAAPGGASSDGVPPGPPPDGGGRGPGGGGGPFGGGGGGGVPITTDTIAQAQTVLSTTQLAALQQMQTLQQAQQQAMQALRNNGAAAAPSTGATPTTNQRGPGRS